VTEDAGTVDVFAQLPPDERRELETLLRPALFGAGARIFDQASPGDCAMFVRRGTVRLVMELPGERRLEVARLGPGAFFGELALLRAGPRHLAAEAVDDVTVDIIERADFQGLRFALRPASFSLMLAIARRMAALVSAADAATRAMVSPSPTRPVGPAPIVGTLGTLEAPGSDFDPRPFLGALRFFSSFSPADRDALLDLGTLWTLPRGREIITEGGDSTGMFVVIRGAVEALAGPGLSRVALIGPGQPVGVLSPLLQVPPIASCRMREDGTVLQLDDRALGVLLTPSRRLSYRFLDALCLGLIENVARANRVLGRIEGQRRALMV